MIYFAVTSPGSGFWSLSLSKGIKQAPLSAASSQAKWAAQKRGAVIFYPSTSSGTGKQSILSTAYFASEGAAKKKEEAHFLSSTSSGTEVQSISYSKFRTIKYVVLFE